MKREFSAGGVCYKKEDGRIFVVIYKPKGKETWQLPKGWIDKGEKSQEAAVREVREEGGVEGRAIQKIDTIKYFFNWQGEKIFKTVTFYLMEYVSGKPEDHTWEAEIAELVEIDEAIERLTFKDEKEIVRKAKKLFGSKS
jgi:8-oxo-dGTP diphosphatase